MNKKLCFLFILPFLCSCHGTTVSCETVIKNIGNIRSQYYSNPTYAHFTLTSSATKGENVYYSHESYDVEQKFYHRYELENNVLKCEEWKYVQTNSDGDINIYTVERKPIEFGDDKPVVTNKILFSDEVWKVQDTLLRLNLNNTHSLKLNESEEIINYYLQDESKKTLSLSSLNSTSFYLDYVQRVDEETVAVDIKIEFKDSLFLSSNTIDGKDSSTTIKCSYDNFDILYPKLK